MEMLSVDPLQDKENTRRWRKRTKATRNVLEQSEPNYTNTELSSNAIIAENTLTENPSSTEETPTDVHMGLNVPAIFEDAYGDFSDISSGTHGNLVGGKDDENLASDNTDNEAAGNSLGPQLRHGYFGEKLELYLDT